MIDMDKKNILPNGEHVHPLPATREDELGVKVVTG